MFHYNISNMTDITANNIMCDEPILMENFGYLLAAYTIVWAVLFGYVLSLIRRQRQLQRQVDSLKATPRKKEED